MRKAINNTSGKRKREKEKEAVFDRFDQKLFAQYIFFVLFSFFVPSSFPFGGNNMNNDNITGRFCH